MWLASIGEARERQEAIPVVEEPVAENVLPDALEDEQLGDGLGLRHEQRV